ncbi:MAG TPA: hydroxymethylbilane synthase [Aeromonadales bacterium]|nr:hydroxymethylbilane synthase [Aeromonadales bacterium]
MSDTIKIATRKSPLALWQANYVAEKLKQYHPTLTIELVTMTTKGDKILDAPLAKIGGKGLFVKELEVAMLSKEADIAVHSMKDVPMFFPEGLVLHTICPREQPFDAFVSNHFKTIKELPAGAVVGTSSLRRKSQLKALRPDLLIRDLRGNVGTRLAKLDAGEYDAIILAAAGLIRLDKEHRIAEIIASEIILPAVGQGAVGIECREDDVNIQNLLKPLHCEKTACRVYAERAMNERLNGGCQVPIAGFAVLEGNQLKLQGLVASENGDEIIKKQQTGCVDQYREIGLNVAEKLLDAGANRILDQIYKGLDE